MLKFSEGHHSYQVTFGQNWPFYIGSNRKEKRKVSSTSHGFLHFYEGEKH